MSTTLNPLRRRGVNKLPVELLVEIFKLASTDHFLDEDRTVPPAHTLIWLSHVCRTWRVAIRGAPQLWTIICGVERPMLIRNIVTLARKMPLAILRVQEEEEEAESDTEGGNDSGEEHCDEGDEDNIKEQEGIEDNGDDEDAEKSHDGDDEDKTARSSNTEDIWVGNDGENDNDGHDKWDSESSNGDENDDRYNEDGGIEEVEPFGVTSRFAAEILLAELPRISDIQISLKREDIPGLLHLFDVDAPLLESLELRVVCGYVPVVFNPFRGGAPPRLTRLSLTGGCELSHTSSLWKNLTHFHLQSHTCPRDPYQADGGFALFSQALRQMSSLTNLSMCFAIPPGIFDTEPWKTQPINLPRLTTLTIRDRATKSAFFLQAIKCRLEKLYITADEDADVSDYDYPDMFNYMLGECERQMASALTQKPLTLVRMRRTSLGFQMKGYCRDQDIPASSSPSEVDMQIRVESVHGKWGDVQMMTEDLVMSAISIIPRRETPTLWLELEDMDGLDLSLVAQHLRESPGLQCYAMRICGYPEEWWRAPEGHGDVELHVSDTITDGDALSSQGE
ncbi:hypothetical protein EYR40_006112 [Pleurotus pulmonarius]|nr:hypothetical protein EYR36_010734 [Pleurotus pulmonarius]KAF4599024.1 hypothetical protein EYR40_006112 [Pleurotus pulmonarius]